ncbi:MAG: septation protein A [Sphingomonadaceae bacterium]
MSGEAAATEGNEKDVSGGLRLALDLGPLIIFFAAYYFTSKNVFIATGIFMAATAVAMLISYMKTGKVSAMLLFSGVMVLGFGGLTIWLHDESFIKLKPTLYYLMVAGILFFGLWSKRPTLKLVLGHAYPGLSEKGWALLSRNWAIFFLVLAASNELVWRTMSTEFWLGYKLWGALPATIVFALANLPMLNRHGLSLDKTEADVPSQG